MVLKQLQHFLSYLQQFERVFIRRQIDTTLAERRYELSAKQKQIEKDEKRMDELDRLFRKIYEDNVSGKLNDERFYKLSDGYEAEQGQLKREIDVYKRQDMGRCRRFIRTMVIFSTALRLLFPNLIY